MSRRRPADHGAPVLVSVDVVDDLQWIDTAGARALAFALRRTGAPVSLLAPCGPARAPTPRWAPGGW